MQVRYVTSLLKSLILPLLLAVAPAHYAIAQPADYSVTKYLCPIGSNTHASDILNDCSQTPILDGYAGLYANAPVTFGLEIDFDTTAPNADQRIQDYLPAGFTFVSMSCSTDGAPDVPVSAFGVVFGPPDVLHADFNSNGAQTTTCAINGFFSGDPNTFEEENNIGVFDPINAPGNISDWGPLVSDHVGYDTDIPLQFPVDVSISKSASESFIDVSGGPVEVEYTVVIKNESPASTGQTVLLGQGFGVHDQQALMPNSVAFHASLTEFSCATTNASGDCVVLPSNVSLPVVSPITVGSINPGDLFMAQFPAGQNGELGPQDEITLTYKVKYSKFLECTRFGTDGINNTVFFNQTYVNGNGQTVGTIFEANAANNTDVAAFNIETGETFLNPDCPTPPPTTAPDPIITVSKAIGGTGGLVDWTTGVVDFKIILENISGASGIPAQTVNNIRLRDTLLQFAGTPGFRAEMLTNWNCTLEDSNGNQASPDSQCSTVSSNSPQDFNYYGAHHQMWELNPQNITLAAGDKAVIKFQMTFDDLTCDSLDINALNRIRNRAWAAYGPVNVEFFDGTFHDVNYAMHDDAVVEMANADECNFQVVKKTQNPKIVFNTDVKYRVLFSNNDSQSRIVGTTYDAIRIFQSDYAVGMQFDYEYSCAVLDITKPVIPVGAMPDFPANSGLSGFVSHNTLPSQGARIIDFGPLEYAAGAELVCDITINVKQPTDKSLCKGDEFAHLENIALMDISRTYNNNLPFPPSGPSGIYSLTNPTTGTAVPNPSNQTDWDSWSSLSLPLPKCYDISVSKTVENGLTWEGGPSPVFEVSVSNLGDDLVGWGNNNDWNGILLSDVISPLTNTTSTLDFGVVPGSLNVLGSTCFQIPGTPGSVDCVWRPNGLAPFPLLPFDLGLGDFDGGEAVTATYQVDGFTRGDKFCNTASAVMAGINADEDWFTHPPADSETKCFRVLEHGDLEITKTVLNHTLGTIPTLDYQFDVSCSQATAPTFDANNPTANQHVTVAGVQGGQSASGNTHLNFPVHSGGGDCTVSEAGILNPFDLDQANAEFAFCEKTHLAVWRAPVYVPASAATSGGINVPSGGQANVEVINELVCEPRISTLTVTKSFEGKMPGSGDFWVNVTCTPSGGTPNPLILNFANGYSASHTNVPVGAVCNIVEVLPSPNQPDPPKGCKWAAEYPNGQSTTVGLDPAHLSVVNRVSCPAPIPSELLIRKTFLNNTHGTIADAEFKFEVACSGPVHTISVGIVTPAVASGSGVGGLGQVLVPTSASTGSNDCRVTEFAPEQINGPLDPEICRKGEPVWVAPIYNFNGTVVAAGANLSILSNSVNVLSVVNEVICKAKEGGETALIITKKPDMSAINPPLPLSGAEFTVNVNCGPSSNHNVDLNIGNGFTEILTGLNVGTQCTVTEIAQTVPGFPDNCKWDVSYDPQGQEITLHPTGNQVVVYNTAVCSEIKPKQKAELLITKEVINPRPNQAVDPDGLVFEVDLTCGLQNVPVTQTHEFKLPSDLQTIVSGLTAGDLCVISERPLNGQGIEKHCEWSTSYQGPPTFSLVPGFNQIKVINTVNCDGPTTGGGQPKARANLVVTKTGPATCEAGADCAFDIEVRNNSNVDYFGPVVVRDLASPSGLSIGSGQFSPWTCTSGAGATALCTHPPVTIAAGSSRNLQLPLKIPPSFKNGQSIKNCAELIKLADIDLRTEMHTTQFLLNALGYNVGKVDGVAGRQTRAGAAQFRKDSGIPKSTPILDALRMELVRNPATGEQFSRESCTKVQVTKTLSCRFGQEPVDGECRAICPERNSNWNGRSCVSCKAGTNWNGKTRTCVKPAPKPVECVFPKVISPRTGQCIDVIAECPFGSILNIGTGQCVSIIPQCPPGTRKVPGLEGCHK